MLMSLSTRGLEQRHRFAAEVTPNSEVNDENDHLSVMRDFMENLAKSARLVEDL